MKSAAGSFILETARSPLGKYLQKNPTFGLAAMSAELKEQNEQRVKNGDSDLTEPPLSGSGTVDFDGIVAAHGRLLFSIAYTVLRNPEDAEDIVQETFIRAFRTDDIMKVERMQAWLGHIAWRLAMNRAKKQSKRKPSVQLEELAGTLPLQDPGAEALLLTREREALLVRALQSLPDELRETYILHAVNGITSPIAAEILGVAESSVRDRLSKARKLIKQKLAVMMERGYGA